MRESFKKVPLGIWALALAVAAGIVFRLIWTSDMEYKGDEMYMFERSQKVGGRSRNWREHARPPSDALNSSATCTSSSRSTSR